MTLELRWAPGVEKTVATWDQRFKDAFAEHVRAVQLGAKPPDEPPNSSWMTGFNGSVIEIRPHRAYRGAVQVALNGYVYVLHAWKKDSKEGIATRERHQQAIKHRLIVQQQHRAR
jgi:phage-related protein